MKYIFVILFLSVLSLEGSQTPEEGLKRLKEGNRRFVSEVLLHPNRSMERRLSLSETQSPFAVIVTCSDSRVVPEIIFDEGLGDLFVIRVAGNVIGSTELESVEYAVAYLQPVVVVVMGHERCGAVDAVVQGVTQDIPEIAALIKPSVEKAKSMQPANLLKLSTELNAERMRAQLFKSPVIDKKVQTKSIAIHAAYYNLQTGAVNFLSQ
ncbi:MAG: carbonic anhydrase [Chlamydiales bacterium]